jgi:hypothetical protein
MACSGRIVDLSGKIHNVVLKVGDHEVCAATWGALRGIAPSTVATIVRRVWAGFLLYSCPALPLNVVTLAHAPLPLHSPSPCLHHFAGDTSWNDGLERMHQQEGASRRGTQFSCAVQWWIERLGYYEMTTKLGVIMYPRDVCWVDVYNDEFVPEMQLMGVNWKATTAPKKNRDEVDAEIEADYHSDSNETVVTDYGSRSSWYRAKKAALKQVS